MACDSRRALRNEQRDTGPVFVFELFAPVRQKQNRPSAHMVQHFRVLQEANHELYGCAPVLMISVLSPCATPG